MKITALDSNTKKPLANVSIQLQIRGQNSGFLTVRTDANGLFMLDDSYMGHQIASTQGSNPNAGGSQGQWIPATDGGKLTVVGVAAGAKQKTTTTTGSTK